MLEVLGGRKVYHLGWSLQTDSCSVDGFHVTANYMIVKLAICGHGFDGEASRVNNDLGGERI